MKRPPSQREIIGMLIIPAMDMNTYVIWIWGRLGIMGKIARWGNSYKEMRKLGVMKSYEAQRVMMFFRIFAKEQILLGRKGKNAKF